MEHELKITIIDEEGLGAKRKYRLSKKYHGSFDLDEKDAHTVVLMLASDLNYNLTPR